MTYGVFRTSHKFYKSRPPANCVTARKAWDLLAQKGPIVSMRLLDGLWMCERENGDLDDVENVFELNRKRAEKERRLEKRADSPNESSDL
jgi:hypothetical protein